MSHTTRPPAISRNRPSRRSAAPAAARSNVDTRRAAELLGMSNRTLEKWRGQGTGPPFLKLGRRVLYSVVDLEEWIRSRRRRSTSEG